MHTQKSVVSAYGGQTGRVHSVGKRRNDRVLSTYTGFVSRGGQALMALGMPARGAELSQRVHGRGSRGMKGGKNGSRRVTKMMFERFTEKAIKVVMLAQEEARRLGHNFVGTEQILLGLIGESTGRFVECSRRGEGWCIGESDGCG